MSLEKPDSVKKACADPGARSCIDKERTSKADASAPDERAVAAVADTASASDQTVAPEIVRVAFADASDSPPDNTSDVRGPQDPDAGDAFSAPEDARTETASPLPAEPQGPEPGPEPGSGSEPQPEPRPEPGPEPPRDGGNTSPDGAVSSCASPKALAGTSNGGNLQFNTTDASCFVTCDTVNYWGCSNFTESTRTLKVNGVSTPCGAALPPKRPGGYYYFEIGPGGHSYDGIWWAGPPAASCPTPTGGFTPS